MVKSYPSDISIEKFEKIRVILESCRKKTKPRTVDLHKVFCGVLYVLKSGCQWRMLPSDFPKWRTCYDYYQKWSEQKEDKPSILEQVLKKNSWRGSTKAWSEGDHKFLYS